MSKQLARIRTNHAPKQTKNINPVRRPSSWTFLVQHDSTKYENSHKVPNLRSSSQRSLTFIKNKNELILLIFSIVTFITILIFFVLYIRRRYKERQRTKITRVAVNVDPKEATKTQMKNDDLIFDDNFDGSYSSNNHYPVISYPTKTKSTINLVHPNGETHHDDSDSCSAAGSDISSLWDSQSQKWDNNYFISTERRRIIMEALGMAVPQPQDSKKKNKEEDEVEEKSKTVFDGGVDDDLHKGGKEVTTLEEVAL